ncbi:MAG TPA: hypothetical protein ACQGQH_07415 [Xylella sp.]
MAHTLIDKVPLTLHPNNCPSGQLLEILDPFACCDQGFHQNNRKMKQGVIHLYDISGKEAYAFLQKIKCFYPEVFQWIENTLKTGRPLQQQGKCQFVSGKAFIRTHQTLQYAALAWSPERDSRSHGRSTFSAVSSPWHTFSQPDRLYQAI